MKPNVVSEEFRRFPADTFSLRINNNLAQVTFSLETADAEEREIVLKEATVILTPQSLKVLQIVLTNALGVFEEQFGAVRLAPGKEEELSKRDAKIDDIRDCPEKPRRPLASQYAKPKRVHGQASAHAS